MKVKNSRLGEVLRRLRSNLPRLAEASPLLPDDNSELEPPDPISNSAVKRLSADGSVGFPHVRVGHCQAPIRKPGFYPGLFFACAKCRDGFLGRYDR